MKVKGISSGLKKIAAVATGALFLGATLGAASVFGSGLSTLPGSYLSSGAVNSVVVVGASAAAQDILGSIDIAAALTAAAAATHSPTGSVVIGATSFSSTSKATAPYNGNDTLLAWNPTTAMLGELNWSAIAGNLKSANYTSIENISFSSSAKAYVNGLNVVLPVGSYWLSSYTINDSASKAIVPLNKTGLNWMVGLANTASLHTLLNWTKDNYTMGVKNTYTNIKVPGTLTVGAHTVGLEGLATVAASPSYTQLEFSVDNGATNYVNLTGSGDHSTVSGVTLTLGAPALTNTSGTFLRSLSVSSTTFVQNWSSKNLFGLGAYNTTAEVGGGGYYLNFSNTAKSIFNYSFSGNSNALTLPVGPTIALNKLVPLYTAVGSAVNLTVAVGNAQTDTLSPVANVSTASLLELNATHALTNVGFGVDFRGNLPSSGSTPYNPGGPDGSLQGYQWYTNTSNFANVIAKSEYIYPLHGQGTNINWTNSSEGPKYNEFEYTVNAAGGASSRILYVLPNGQKFALVYTGAHINNATLSAGDYFANLTNLLVNFTSSGFAVVPSPSGTYKLGGFNLTISGVRTAMGNTTTGKVGHTTVKTASLLGPMASVGTYNIVPGYSSLYAANGTAFTTVHLASGMGTLALNTAGVLTYTDPIGGTQTVTVYENPKYFNTSITHPANTTANTWGDKVVWASVSGATIQIPTENYTLALGGATVISSKKTYTTASNQSVSGVLVSLGTGSSISASGLFSSGVFPLAELDSQFVGSTNTVPVVVVGGPAVNSLAKTLLGITTYTGGAQFTQLTNVTSGEALVEMFSNVAALGNQNAVLIAGYNAGDTLNAAEAVAEYLVGTPVTGVNLNGTKMILSTSSSSYTGVSVVSQS